MSVSETIRETSDDFWQEVEKTHEWGCWIWHGPTDRKGYGRWKNRHPAHREAWKRERGPIGAGLSVLHICDQPPCVNPRHLYLGTHVENGIDAHVRGRVPDRRKKYCPKGHAKEGDNLLVFQNGGKMDYRCRRCDNERKNEAQKAARRARGLQKTRMTAEEKARIWELCQVGTPRRQIAVEVGRSLWSVHQAITEARASGDR
ncbi:HNH endonuclease [Streptomyces sp. NPDC059441]|uniref:HNH endonuclease n=1 Tax=Streptomyces sp. NPDC059441 TaxID=3346829 RepID=UPI0036827A13